MASGTFTYQFDFIGSPPVDVSANLPIINGDGSFTTLTPSYSVVGNTMIVDILYVYVDNGTTNDGLTFANVFGYYNTFTNLTITVFGDIPLSRGGQQFRGLNSLTFTSTNPPTILSNTSFQYCFYQSSTFNSDISNWNVSNAINMQAMFSQASSFNKNISGWNVSNVTHFNSMFYNANAFNQPIGTWNVSSCTNFGAMFLTDNNFGMAFDQDLSGWGAIKGLANSMFERLMSFTGTNPNIGGWNVSQVTRMDNMFSVSNFNNNISSWDVSNVTRMTDMFSYNTSFNQPIGNWIELATRVSIPLAAGENMRGHSQFNEAIDSGAFAVLQPDIGKWGGFSGCIELAKRITAKGILFCPHWLGGGIGLLASMHLKAAIGGDGFVEVDANPNPLRELLANPYPLLQNGSITLSDLPGLGIEPNLQALQAFQVPH